MTNPLASNLTLLGAFLIGVGVYVGITYVARKQSEERDRGFSWFLIGLGAYSLFYGVFYSITWPFPGAYNILFGDSYAVLGFLALFSGLTIHAKGNIEFIGIFAFFAGLYAIISGIVGYQLSLTKVPIAMLGMYLASGAAGVLMLPLGFTKNRIIAILFVIAIVIGGIVALIIGLPAIKEHMDQYAGVILGNMISA